VDRYTYYIYTQIQTWLILELDLAGFRRLLSFSFFQPPYTYVDIDGSFHVPHHHSLLPKTSSSQPTTPLSLLFLMRTDMNTSYSRIDLSCRHSLSLTYLIDIIFVCHNPFFLSLFSGYLTFFTKRGGTGRRRLSHPEVQNNLYFES